MPQATWRSRLHPVPTARTTAPRPRTSRFLGGRSDASPADTDLAELPGRDDEFPKGRIAAGRERRQHQPSNWVRVGVELDVGRGLQIGYLRV